MIIVLKAIIYDVFLVAIEEASNFKCCVICIDHNIIDL